MPTVSSITDGIELVCCREGGKLRMRVVSDGYDTTLNVQFPRALRAEGARYQVEDLSLSQDGSFYRALGQIARVSSGQDVFARRTHPSVVAKASRPAKTLDDLDETTEVGNGILVQCVRDGSKLRARVVSDGYHPDWNMRFPRGIREEGLLFVVDQVTIGAGNSYIASGNIRKFVQQI
jgi:Ca-activated chloride channel family protein